MTQHIEMLGLPGSGKTTLYQTLPLPKQADALILSIQKALSIPFLRAALHALPSVTQPHFASYMFHHFCQPTQQLKLFTNDHPALVNHTRHIIQSYQPTKQDKQLTSTWLSTLFTHYHFFTQHCPPHFLFALDEGFASRTLSLFAYAERPIEPTVLKEYINLIPKPAAVLLTQASPSTCLIRLKQRNRLPIRMQQLPSPAFLNNYQVLLDLTATHLTSIGVPVHIINTNQAAIDSRQLCKSVVAKLTIAT